MQHISSAISKT